MSRSSVPQLSVVTGGRQAAGEPEPADALPPPKSKAARSPDPELAMESRLVSKRLFGRFELLIEMGRGGMATLYLARIQGPQQFEKLLAIKRIHDHLSYEVGFVNMFQKVVDFGIAYAAQRLHTTGAGTLKGKVSYIAPEQTDGRAVDHRADIFALGVVLYEAVTVSRLFRGETDAETLLKVRHAVVPSARQRNPDLPAKLEDILRKALARRPEDRYDTAEALSDALEELLMKEGQVVGRQRVANRMKDLFYDRRKLKEQQIRIALSTSDCAPGGDARGGDVELPAAAAVPAEKARPRPAT